MNPFHILIIHGTKAAPERNWFPWLSEKLRADGHEVTVPQFPTPENQNFPAWRAVAEEALAGADPARTILVGHSTGSVFVLRMAELAAARPFHAVFSVCPFAVDLGLAFDPLNETFVHHPFDWEKIRTGAGRLFLYASDNDAYVPLSRSRDVADSLAAPLRVIREGGHLNTDSGYTQFDLLLGDLRGIV